MVKSVESDKDEVCKKIELIIVALCEKHNLKPLRLRLGMIPDYQHGGTKWDGSVQLSIGV